MKYLTQILDKPVLASDGRPLGRVHDVLAAPGLRFPALTAFLVRVEGKERALPYEAVAFTPDPEGPQGTGRIHGPLRLRQPLESLPDIAPDPAALRLRRDVLDQQIVDVYDYRVVRVSDIRLAECGQTYCVVGVDASLRATLRRLGPFSQTVEALARRLGRPLRAQLIAWDDVQTLEPGQTPGPLRLKVPHDKLAQLHPADIADIVEQLHPRDRAEIFQTLELETAADALEEMQPDVQREILEQLDDRQAADLLEEMEPDEAADLLDDLPQRRSAELLAHMTPQDAAPLHRLLAFDEDTAGGLMTTEFVAISQSLTCAQTIDRLRQLAPRAETIYYVYVLDAEDRLVGVLSLRDLIIAPPETPVQSILTPNVIHVYTDDTPDRVAHVIARYNLLAVPVLDPDARLQGIITVDDTLERLLPPEPRRLPRLPRQTPHDD